MTTSSSRFLLFALLILGTLGARADILGIENPWIREAPPNARVLAAYLTVRNNTDRPVTITAATSPAFGSAMMHDTIEENGMSRMVHIDRLEIPPHGEIRFAPGGRHIMLFDPEKRFKAGDKVPLVLHMDNGICNFFDATVRKTQP